MTTFQTIIFRLTAAGETRVYDAPVDPNLELCAAAAKELGKTTVFQTLSGYPGFRAVTEVLCSGARCEQIFGMDRKRFLRHISQAAASPAPCVMASHAHFANKLDGLGSLPIPRFFSSDGGKYITAGILTLPYGSRRYNVSFNRLMVVDDNHLAFNIHRGKHTDLLCTDAEKRGERMPAAIVIGSEPAVMLAAASPAPMGTDEFMIASALKGEALSLSACPVTGILVPSESEIVIEGYVEPQKVPEGPFVDYLGVMHGQGMGRLFTVEGIYCGADPVFHALMPGDSYEHLQLMALPVEAEIAQRLNKLTRFHDVCLTRESGLFHAVASIRKSSDGEAKTALMAMLSAYPFIKHAVVVDETVDIRSSASVEKAIALCVQADTDVIVVPGAKSTMVDPRSTADLLGAKMGIDATRPIHADIAAYQSVPWPRFD